MKIEIFDIVFDKPDNIFYAGEHLTGKLVIKLKYPMEVQGVYMDIAGSASCEWFISEGDSEKTYSAEETYLGQRILFYGSMSDDASLIYHPGGLTEYPFDIVIPSTAPTSFEGSKGHVRYKCMASIDRGWKGNYDTEETFTVIHHLVLSQTPNVAYPVSAEEDEEIDSCCHERGILHAKVSLPKKGYIPGELLEATVEVQNRSSHTVSGLTLNLHQTVAYTGYSDGISRRNPNCRTKHRMLPMFECIEPFPKRFAKTLNVAATIPAVPPSKLEGCSIIDINYDLLFQIECGYPNLEIEMEVFIGTVAVSSDEAAPVARQVPVSIPIPHSSGSATPPRVAEPRPSAPPYYKESPPAYEDIVQDSSIPLPQAAGFHHALPSHISSGANKIPLE